MTGPSGINARARLYAELMLERFGDPAAERYVRCPDRPSYTGDGPTAEWVHAAGAEARLRILAKETDDYDNVRERAAVYRVAC